MTGLEAFDAPCRRAIEDAETFEQRVTALQGRWRERLGKVRANSAADLLIGALPGAPIVTVNGAAGPTGDTRSARPTRRVPQRQQVGGLYVPEAHRHSSQR